jgi:nucleoside-diphosphate-sugar epimerase
LIERNPPSPPRVLVVGGSGFIGTEIVTAVRERTDAVGTFRSTPADPPSFQFDLSQEPNLDTSDYDVLVLSTGACRELSSDDELPRLRRDMQRLGESAASLRIVLLSTDAALGDGGPHSTSARGAPTTLYGKASAAAEEIILGHPQGTVVRTSYVFGIGRRGPDKRMRQLLDASREGRQVPAARDLHRSPTEVHHLASRIADIALTPPASRVIHVAGPRMSVYDHFSRLVEAMGLRSELIAESRALDLGIPEYDTSLAVDEGEGSYGEYEDWLDRLKEEQRGHGG